MENLTKTTQQEIGTRDFDEPERCEFCGALRRHVTIPFGNQPIILPFLEPCECAEGKADYERRQREDEERRAAEEKENRRKMLRQVRSASGIPLRYQNADLDTLCVNENNRAAIEAVRKYAENFKDMLPSEENPAPTKNGFYICGTVGTGKTHLAAAVANRVLEMGYRIRFTTMIDLLSELIGAMNSGDSLNRIMKDYKTVSLLVIDDLGKESVKEWSATQVFSILNARNANCLPTIITTNFSNTDLAARLTPRDCSDNINALSVTDRIREMCALLVLTGESRRGVNN